MGELVNIYTHYGDKKSTVNVLAPGGPPKEGHFYMWRKDKTADESRELLVKLFVPAKAKRSGGIVVSVSEARVSKVFDAKTGEALPKKVFTTKLGAFGVPIKGVMSRDIALVYQWQN